MRKIACIFGFLVCANVLVEWMGWGDWGSEWDIGMKQPVGNLTVAVVFFGLFIWARMASPKLERWNLQSAMFWELRQLVVSLLSTHREARWVFYLDFIHQHAVQVAVNVQEQVVFWLVYVVLLALYVVSGEYPLHTMVLAVLTSRVMGKPPKYVTDDSK